MGKYKPIIQSLVRFFLVYLVLIGIYEFYLYYYQDKLATCDPFTMKVAKESASFLSWFGIDSKSVLYNKEDIMRFFIGSNNTSFVNEGCNALSVIILYVSFILAFPSRFIKTFVFLLITIILLHLANIARIAFINYVIYNYPEHATDVHDYIFPMIIYGIVILFWIIWIRFFVFTAKNESE